MKSSKLKVRNDDEGGWKETVSKGKKEKRKERRKKSPKPRCRLSRRMSPEIQRGYLLMYILLMGTRVGSVGDG